MKCYAHNESDSVSQCHECGRGLCTPCSSRFTLMLCEGCLIQNNGVVKSDIQKSMFFSIIFSVLGIIMAFSMNGDGITFLHKLLLAVIVGYIGGNIIAGWKALNRITPNVFLFLPLVGWLIYFYVKFCLAIIIGIFYGPIKSYKMVKELKFINETKKLVAAGKI